MKSQSSLTNKEYPLWKITINDMDEYFMNWDSFDSDYWNKIEQATMAGRVQCAKAEYRTMEKPLDWQVYCEIES